MSDSMGASPKATSPRRSKARRLLWPLITVVASVTVGSLTYAHLSAAKMQGGQGARAAAPAGKPLPGMASASGTVTSSKPFKAAQVYFRNEAKRVSYMVYTNAGQYRVVNIFPGDYEVSARAADLEADVQRVTVKIGEAPTVSLTLKDVDRGEELSYIETRWGGPNRNLQTATYDELYGPPGNPGRQIAERTCLRCHGENFLPQSPGDEDWWRGRIERKMMARDVYLGKRPATSYAEGFLHFRNQVTRYNRHDHEIFVAYVVKQFGPDAQPRQVRVPPGEEPQYDEEALGKAQYIEYYLPPDAPGQGAQARDVLLSGFKGRRVANEVQFDAEGSAWGVDRGYPSRLFKLNPLTGEIKDYPLPEPTAAIHDFIVSRDGIVWLPQHGGAIPYGPQKLFGLNIRSEKWEYAIDMDPNNVIRYEIKWMQSLAEDSKGNIYAGWFLGGSLSKFHRAEKRVTVHPLPYPNAMIYGVTVDKDDTVYAVDWSGKIAALHGPTATADAVGSWQEYVPPVYPNQIRRPRADYQGNIMYGIWSGGPQSPGMVGQFDPRTGKHTQWRIPERIAQPYDTFPDLDRNRVWFLDSGTATQGAQIGVLDRKTGKFTFYPKPQFDADSPKMSVTRDGAVWYASRRQGEPRPGRHRDTAVGVLYPDKDKMGSMGAFFVNGPPGYAFKPGQ